MTDNAGRAERTDCWILTDSTLDYLFYPLGCTTQLAAIAVFL